MDVLSVNIFFINLVDCKHMFCYNIFGATLFGRRLAFSARVIACVYIEIHLGNLTRRFVLMLTTELFIAIISLCITCFALGYAVGSKSNDKPQK